MDSNETRLFRLISNNVRFGYGRCEINGRIVYFAFHGFPNRNDDFFTNVEITEDEFLKIEREYPVQISANSEQGLAFRSKYVDGHPVLLEGWNKLL